MSNCYLIRIDLCGIISRRTYGAKFFSSYPLTLQYPPTMLLLSTHNYIPPAPTNVYAGRMHPHP